MKQYAQTLSTSSGLSSVALGLSISPSNGLKEEGQNNSPRKVSKEEKIHFIFLEGKANEFGEFPEMKRNLYLWKFFSPRAFEFPFHEIGKSQL